MGGKVTTTGAARVEESRPTKTSTRGSRKTGAKRRTILGEAVTAAMQAAGDKLARAARRSVPWVRKATHDQLRWVANDKAHLTEREFVAWLQEIASVDYRGAGLLWQPDRPHALIAHALRQEQQDAQERAAIAAEGRIPAQESTAYRQRQQDIASLEALFARIAPQAEPEKRQYTAEERRAAQLAGRYRPQDILDHRDAHGEDDAFDLYGVDLVAWADRLDASSRIRTYA